MSLAVPVPANGVAGVDVSAAFWNAQVRDAITFLANPPICEAVQTVAQSIPTSTPTPINFDTNVVDSYNGHSTVTNTSRYTAQVAGWYALGGVVSLTANTTGTFRVALWAVNGTLVNGGAANQLPGGSSTRPAATGAADIEVFLNVGDFVTLNSQQDSTASPGLNTSVATPNSSRMSIRWVHA